MAATDLDALLAARIEALERASLLRSDRVIADRTRVACSNLYLDTEGVAGAGGSRLISGTRPIHLRLEDALASWIGREATLLFNSGYAANAGAIPALCRAGDAVFSDALNHASIVDGVRLASADRVVFPHADVGALDAALSRCTALGARWVVTESVFSMDGDLAPLRALADVCRAHGAYLYVDEAHALGVVGPRGCGAVEELGLRDDVPIVVGTLGKAFGAFGAFTAGSARLRRYLVNTARTFIFSTALPEAVAQMGLTGLERVRDGDAQRVLRRRLERLCSRLEEAGWWRGRARSAIIPLVVGDPARAVAWAEAVEARGFFVQAIRPPTVPAGTSRLRVTVSASYSDGLVDALADALLDSAQALGIVPVPAAHVEDETQRR